MWVEETRHDARGVVVIVHGAGEHHERYTWVIKQWNEAGFHVVIGDLPGQGARPKHRGHIHSFNEYIETVERWIAEATMYQLPLVLFGHSMGGVVVSRYLMEKQPQNIRAVVLSSPCIRLKEMPPAWKRGLAYFLNVFHPSLRFKTHIKEGSATRNKALSNQDLTDPHYVRHVSVRWYLEFQKAMAQCFEGCGKFPDVPLLIIQGGDDRLCDKGTAKRWFEGLEISNKTYKEWEGLYHEVLNEPERDEVFTYIKNYIDGIIAH